MLVTDGSEQGLKYCDHRTNGGRVEPEVGDFESKVAFPRNILTFLSFHSKIQRVYDILMTRKGMCLY